jgi:DNA-binding HxlR family transcriptional regulator
LERFGLVERYDFGEVPPHVEYKLTALGLSLSLPVEQLERWVAKNYFEVWRAKDHFDARSTRARTKRAA